MRKSVAALLVILAGWLIQDGCDIDALACNLTYLQEVYAAISGIIQSATK